MTRTRRSFRLLGASWRVLCSERHLLAIAAGTVIGGFATLVLCVLVLVSAANAGMGLVVPIAVIACLLPISVVTTYGRVALASGANDRLQGRDSNLGQCLAVANSRMVPILQWGVVRAGADLLAAQLRRFGIVGQIAAGVAEAAWRVLTCLAIPVIAVEGLRPKAAFSRSKELITKTWGEVIVSMVGFTLAGFVLIALPAAGMVALAVVLIAFSVGPIGLIPIALAVPYGLAGALVLATLTDIFYTALYRYAVDGVVPSAFADTGLETAIAPKR